MAAGHGRTCWELTALPPQTLAGFRWKRREKGKEDNSRAGKGGGWKGDWPHRDF